MTQTGYLILAICIIIALLVTFVVTFVLYKRTPVPAGCESIHVNEEKCAGCKNTSCSLRKEKEE